MSEKQPKVFLGVPTGPSKLYSTYYMIAALENLDWKDLEIHFALTGGEYPAFTDFYHRVKQMVDAVKWPESWKVEVHYAPITPEQRATPFQVVLKNKDVLRDAFLDSGCEYFLLCGGDNPPPRNIIQRLLKLDSDVGIGLCYQRPGVECEAQINSYPLIWLYACSLQEIDALNLDPLNRDELRHAWLQDPLMIPLNFVPNFKEKKVLRGISGGDGCALIKRRVLEMIDWGVMPTKAYHSEDVHFMGLALWYGFTTAVDLETHIPHIHPDRTGF